MQNLYFVVLKNFLTINLCQAKVMKISISQGKVCVDDYLSMILMIGLEYLRSILWKVLSWA